MIAIYYENCNEKAVPIWRNGVKEMLEGTDECEKVLKCYEQCNPACSRSQIALGECNWPMLKYNDDGCVRDCGEATDIECHWSSYSTCKPRAGRVIRSAKNQVN